MGGGGGGGHVERTSTTQVNLTPEQQQLMRMLMPKIQDRLNNPPELFPKSGIAPLDPLQIQAQQMMTDFAGGPELQALIAGAQGGVGKLLGQDPNQQSLSGTAQTGVDQLVSGTSPLSQNLQASTTGPAQILSSGLPGISDVGVDPTGLASLFSPGSNANLQVTSLLGPGGFQKSNPELAQAMQFLLGPVLDPASNPALQAAMNNALVPLQDQFNEVILPGIRSGAVDAGAVGGSRQGIAEGIAGRELLRQSGAITAAMQNENFQNSLQAMSSLTEGTQNATLGALEALLSNQAQQQGISADVLTQSLASKLGAESSRFATATGARNTDVNADAALKQANIGKESAALQANSRIREANLQAQTSMLQALLQNNTANRGLSIDALLGGTDAAGEAVNLSTLPSILTGAVGDQNRAFDQSLLSEEQQRWIAEQNLDFSTVQEVASLFFGMPGGGTTSTSTSQNAGGGGFGVNEALGMATTVLSLFSIFSARWLKQNIKRIGRLHNGIPLYTFSYIYAPHLKFVGAMADEVERIMPEAVSYVNDLPLVNYRKFAGMEIVK